MALMEDKFQISLQMVAHGELKGGIMTYGDLLNLQQTLEKIQGETVPFSTGYKLNKIALWIKDELKFYYDKLNSIFEMYAQRDENGFKFNENKTSILLKPGMDNLCKEALNELNNTSIEIINTRLLSSELEKFNLSIKEIGSLMPLIKEDYYEE